MARQYRSTVEAKTLSSGINNSVTSMTLNSVTTLPSSYPYTLVIDPDLSSEEIVTVTASGGGNVLTITRGQDGTSAQSHNAAAVVKHMITARDLQEPHDHMALSANAHGVTGSVVGTSDTQTLTNKTINLTSNTLTGTTAQFNTALSDGNFSTVAGTETLTNKTLTSPVVTGGTLNGGDALTVTSTELNILDGVTASTAELNILDGVTATTAELNYVDGVTSAIQTQLTTNTPVATIVMYGAAAAPTGWLLCDGTAVSRTTYAALFAVIGTEYGTGDGSTTFTLPDLKGRAPVGYGAGSGLTNRNDLGAKFGTETQTLTEANLPSHDHTIGWQSDGTNDHDHALDSGTVTRVAGPSDGGASGTGTINSGAAGSGTAHNNLQPSTVVNFIIKH